MAIALLLAVGTLASAHRAAAADPKPALTITFAGYDQLISGLKALDELSPHAKLAEKAEAAIGSQTHGKGLAGLDKARPWGVMVSLGENDQPIVQGYLPSTDLKKLLASLPLPGGEAGANANGNFELPLGDKTVYAKQKGKWAVFSDNEETLNSASDEPAFGDAAKKYLLSVSGAIQNIPEARRENALNSLRGLMMFTLATAPEEQRAMMEANIEQMFEKLQKLSKELNSLTIGVGLDTSNKSFFLEFEALGVEGTELAKKFETLKNAKTDFAGFAIPGAALTMLSAGAADDADVAEAKAALATYKTSLDKLLDSNDQLGDKKELAKQLLGDVLGVVEKTVELKKSDAGMAVVLDDGPAAVFGAGSPAGKSSKPRSRSWSRRSPRTIPRWAI